MVLGNEKSFNTSDKFNKTKLLQGSLIKNSDSQLFGIKKVAKC